MRFRMNVLVVATLLPASAGLFAQTSANRSLELSLQTRDPQTNQVKIQKQIIDPRKVGIIVVDPWNYHWCMTWTAQAGGMVPRLNKVLEVARKLGMQVFWAPTDAASMYVGWPQRELALGIPYADVPKIRSYRVEHKLPQGKCHCGPGFACQIDYGENAMPPDLVIADEDLIVSGTQEFYSICRQKGIGQLIYMGGAVNICLTGKPEGLKYMYEAGLDCLVARDLVEAWTQYDPTTGYTPDVGNAQSVVELERGGVATINAVEELRHAGLWDDEWITEPVRITPWGKQSRPYLFEQPVLVSLNTPWLKDVRIHYTMDGSEPIPTSPIYLGPLTIKETTTLRAVAFRNQKQVSRVSDGYFVRMGPVPRMPDVTLDSLKEIPRQYPYLDFFWLPVFNHSYEHKPLRIRGEIYEKGMGMRAPANIMYELKPEWDRFVALAGIDDNLLDVHHGALLAGQPRAVFKVFIDGKLVAESPVMWISQEPWRFDVKIPAGGRKINLVAADMENRNVLNLANWTEAGFILKGEAKSKAPTEKAAEVWELISVPDQAARAGASKRLGNARRAWYRCWVNVPPWWAGKDLALAGLQIEGPAEVYFNGTRIHEASSSASNSPREGKDAGHLQVPVKLVRTGEENLLAIRLSRGGLGPQAPALSTGEQSMRLAGQWQFQLGDNAAWAQWPTGQPAAEKATFSKVEWISVPWDQLDTDFRHASPTAYERFRDRKYGLRIHWGLYSMVDSDASWSLFDHDLAWQGQYHQLYKSFNPTQFNADEWAELMVRTGLKYFTFTTKHHEGFCMWDTKTKVRKRFVFDGPRAGTIEDCDLHYSITETPFRRDVLKELVEAARRHGLGINFYFSHWDWYDADFRWSGLGKIIYDPMTTDAEGWARFIGRHREQVRELLTNYGTIDGFEFDCEPRSTWQRYWGTWQPWWERGIRDWVRAWPDIKETVKMARKLQPDVLFRERGIGAYGDFHTPEGFVPGSPDARTESPKVKVWQVIYPLAGRASYDPTGAAYHDGSWIVSNLVDIVAKGGNFQVGIGPDATGKFHPEAIKALEYAGAWLKVNGEAIYGTRPWVQYAEGQDIRFTRTKDGQHLYAICLKWPGKQLVLKSVRARKGSEIHLLGVQEPLAWRNDRQLGLVVELPEILQAESNRPCRQAFAFKIQGEPARQ